MEQYKITVPAMPDEQRGEITRANAWAETLTITSPEERREAGERAKELATMEKNIRDLFAESKGAANAAHKGICAIERKMLTLVSPAKKLIGDKCMAWDSEVRRLAELERQRLQAEADRKAEAERRRLEGIAKRTTANTELREEYEDQAAEIAPPTVHVPVADDRAEGEVRRTRWTAELVDIDKLIKAAAGGDTIAASLLAYDATAGNRLAVSIRKAGEIVPGVRFTQKTELAFR